VGVEGRDEYPDSYHIQALTEAGCSPAEAVDYLMTVVLEKTQTEWAQTREKDQSTVSQNVRQAKQKLKS
jgi:hypothetical protein